MADAKLTALTADTTVDSADLGLTVEDPGGTPVSKKATWLNILKGAALGVLTADGDLFTRSSGALARITRASLAADSAFSTLYAPIPTYSNYSPTIAQNGTRTTSALTARYVQIGKMVHAWGEAAISNTGTAGNAVTVSLPVTAASASGRWAGAGWFYDASATSQYATTCRVASTTTLDMFDTNVSGNQLGVTPSIAVANGDQIGWSITYEAA